MPKDEPSGLIACGFCKEQIDGEVTVIDGEWDASREHPRVIFSHRCPLCQAEWRSIHELLFAEEKDERSKLA